MMVLILMCRYTEKGRFSSLEELISYLEQYEIRFDINKWKDIEPLLSSHNVVYIGTVKYITCGSYEEALYVEGMSKNEMEGIVAKLQDISNFNKVMA